MDDITYSQYVYIAVAGGNEGQLAAVGEEEVHSTLDCCDCGQLGGRGGLTVVEQGGQGHRPGERPVQMHQQQSQSQTAAVDTSSCSFVLVGNGIEP